MNATFSTERGEKNGSCRTLSSQSVPTAGFSQIARQDEYKKQALTASKGAARSPLAKYNRVRSVTVCRQLWKQWSVLTSCRILLSTEHKSQIAIKADSAAAV